MSTHPPRAVLAGQTVRVLIEAADASTASLVEVGADDVKVTRWLSARLPSGQEGRRDLSARRRM